MERFSNEQKRIAHVIFRFGPRTIEEISQKVGMPADAVSRELKDLLKQKLVSVSGYPPKYSLKKEIGQELNRRKEMSSQDQNSLRLKMIIDVQALVEEACTKSLSEVEKALRSDKDFLIYDIVTASPVKHEESYTSYLEANMSVKDFKALVKLMYFFGPTTVEVLKPKKFEIGMDDLQEGLMDMAEMIQAYNYYILKNMKKDELERFQKKLFR